MAEISAIYFSNAFVNLLVGLSLKNEPYLRINPFSNLKYQDIHKLNILIINYVNYKAFMI